MKKIIFIVICFTSVTVSQHQEIINKLANEFSECLMSIEKSSSDARLVKMFKDCSIKIIGNISKKMIEEIDPTHLEKYISDILTKAAVKNVHCQYIFMKFSLLTSNPSKDSLDDAFENWDITNVTISENPVELKTGKFIDENEYANIYITRSLDKQIELIAKTGYDLELSINWINDFEYELTYLGSSTGYNFYKVGSIFHIKVESVSDDGFTFLVKGNFSPLDKVSRGYHKKID